MLGEKKEYLNSLATKAEAVTHNMKELYAITKRIAGTANRRSFSVKNKDGELLTNVMEQLNRWKEHFAEVLSLNRHFLSELIHLQVMNSLMPSNK